MIYYTPKGVAIIWPEWSKDDLLAMGQVVPRLEPRQEFDEHDRMKPSSYYERLVDVMEELMKFTLLLRDRSDYLVDRYSERVESAEKLSKRVNQATI